MTPSLYDLLDVDESASADEIRAAWKAAIADLDPTDRRFRAYNDAAGVLLDEGKRSSYDAELAAAREAEADDEDDTVAETADVDDPRDAVAETDDTAKPADVPADTRVAETRPVPPPPPAPAPARAGGPGPWSIAVAGVAAVLAVALAVWVLAQPNVKKADDQAARLRAAGQAAQEFVGDKAVPATLSYDYRTLPEDLRNAQQYMTPKAARGEAKNWQVISREAKAQHAVVTATAPMTGLTRISPDGTTAVVTAFVNQQTRKLGTKQVTLQMGVTYMLDRDPKTGQWMVDDLCTALVCGSDQSPGSPTGK